MEVIDEHLIRSFCKIFRKNQDGIAFDWKLIGKEKIAEMYSEKRTIMKKVLKNIRYFRVSPHESTVGEKEMSIEKDDSDNEGGVYTELMTF